MKIDHSIALDFDRRAALIWQVFCEYKEAWLELVASLERCAIKGWPDRARQVHLTMKLQELLAERDTARLKHVLRNSSDTSFLQYREVALVAERIREHWTAADEEALTAVDAGYTATLDEINRITALQDQSALDGPFEMASRDPDSIAAENTYKRKVHGLSARLWHAS